MVNQEHDRLRPGLVCRVHTQDHTSIFTWKNKIELEDHAKLSAYWPWGQSYEANFGFNYLKVDIKDQGSIS